MNYTGSNPYPDGCGQLLTSRFYQGYELEVFSSSEAVTTGGLVCVTAALEYVNGTIVNWGNSSNITISYGLTDSSGNVVNSVPSSFTDAPTYSPSYAKQRTQFAVSGIWDTSIPTPPGTAVPAPGGYAITASTTFPGLAGTPTTATTSVGFTILPPLTTTTSACNAPGVYCGPGFAISNASLISASTLGGNYSLLNFTVHGTYHDLKITSLSIWLANANSSEPNGANGAHLVSKVYPSWGGTDGSAYSFDVPTTGFHAVKGAQCELWIDAYFGLGGLKGDNWAAQNMTIG